MKQRDIKLTEREIADILVCLTNTIGMHPAGSSKMSKQFNKRLNELLVTFDDCWREFDSERIKNESKKKCGANSNVEN